MSRRSNNTAASLNRVRGHIENAFAAQLGFGPLNRLTVEQEEDIQDRANAAIEAWAETKAANPGIEPAGDLPRLLEQFLQAHAKHLAALQADGIEASRLA